MLDIAKWNLEHNTPSELMLAVKALTHGQMEALALDFVWRMVDKERIDSCHLVAKRAILEATARQL